MHSYYTELFDTFFHHQDEQKFNTQKNIEEEKKKDFFERDRDEEYKYNIASFTYT